MIRRMFSRRATLPCTTLSPEDQAAIDAFRAMLAALRTPDPWKPGCAHDIAVRIGPFVERAHTRPGDDHGDLIAVGLQHPGGPYAPYGSRYRKIGWLRCETAKILGLWDPAYAPLTHAAAGLDLPDDIGMPPAHYAIYVKARTPDNSQGHTLLRLGPYTQTRHADRDADRLDSALQGRETTTLPGFRVSARPAPFDVSDHRLHADPYETDAVTLLNAALEDVTAA
ncbi:hypothetical protein OHA98_39830 [Streptomyces sp. NBC_00654]|uniref:hypothetical protein n=1 Tax=Streptomyces sp. NBC_00654 TaxID=2975799 RepID=UPI002257ECC5|nr:hypothetical protein [Streptomyces sp. NBC_00654]MCX4970793.1 hypothetical protein [Streptomyces sp. NBC_00654]